MKPELAHKLLSVAPMMAWTDRHCRYLHRLYAPDALVFTEMVTTGALLHGDQWHQLEYHVAEHPVALQLGGNNPVDLAKCTRRAFEVGYDEINLNVGCPSDRVQQGTFGAVLMRKPQLVADCISAMQEASDVPVTVKCRLGVDDHDSDELLHAFIATVAQAGCRRFYIHARKAILGGLSPAQNRSIPPLQYQRAEAIKRAMPHLEIILNGGITTAEDALAHLGWADGVMIGRAAYHHPDLLAQLQQNMFTPQRSLNKGALLSEYRRYVEAQLTQGVPLHSLTRHLLSSCHGMRGARRFRQTLSDASRLKRNDITLLDEAFDHVLELAA